MRHEPQQGRAQQGRDTKVAIYARCSTADQNIDLQIDSLRDYADIRRLEISAEYVG